jgi:hypothetical protein
VIEKIGRVRYPHLFPLILDRAFELGGIDLMEIRQLLAGHQQKTYAKNYFNFAIQTLLLENSFDNDISIGKFYVSPYGRELYREAQHDDTLALEHLLASLPYYHLHVEILLAELVLKTSARNPHQLPIILDLVKRTIPWYLEYRLPWLQSQVGWKDSSNLQANWKKHQRALGSFEYNISHIDRWSIKYWDERLRFARLSALTVANNLCRFLAGQRERHFIVDLEWISPIGLGALILLVLAQLESRSINLSTVPNIVPALDNLKKIGFDLRVGAGSAYLASPVKIIIKIGKLEDYYAKSQFQEGSALMILFQAMEGSAAWSNPCRSGGKHVDLDSLLREVQDGTLSDLFVFDELSESAIIKINPEIEIWTDCCLSYHEFWNNLGPPLHPSINRFEQDILRRIQPDSESRLYYAIYLSRRGLDDYLGAELEKAINHLPHLYLIVLLLIDCEQSGHYILLVHGQWQYSGIELLRFVDKLLQALGYEIWNEWYVARSERQKEIEERFISYLMEQEVVQVINNRLEMTSGFTEHLMGDMANIRNQTRIIRQRIRSIASGIN